MTPAPPRGPLRLLLLLALGVAASACAARTALPLPSLVAGLVVTRASRATSGSPGPTDVVGLISLVFVPRTVAPATNDLEPQVEEVRPDRFEAGGESSRNATLSSLERCAVSVALSRWLGEDEPSRGFATSDGAGVR